MKKTIIIAFGCTVAAMILTSGQAMAQSGGPGIRPRPTVSPLLSLGGSSPALNYFTIVRPELEFRSLLNKQADEIRTLESRPGADKSGKSSFDYSLPKTGHRVYYSNYSHYYALPIKRQ